MSTLATFFARLTSTTFIGIPRHIVSFNLTDLGIKARNLLGDNILDFEV